MKEKVEQMHYKELLKRHDRFYRWERRAGYYDEYMQRKKWEEWKGPNRLSDEEVRKLFEFIVSWDYHFSQERDRVIQFKQAYRKVFPLFKQLEREKIYKISYEKEVRYPKRDPIRLQEAVSIVFDTIASCFHRYESTDTSKIIHTINPELFVMWDRDIRGYLLGREEGVGEDYAYKFIPMMHKEAREIIQSFIKENHCSEEEAVKKISSLDSSKTLAKLLDEYNYVSQHFKLKELLEEDKLDNVKMRKDEEMSNHCNKTHKTGNYTEKAQRMKELLFKEVDGMFDRAKETIKEMVERGAAHEIIAFVENSVRSRPEIDGVIRKRSKSGKAFADVLPDLREIFKDP